MLSPSVTPEIRYLLQLADNPMILGQRLGEWCGHGPVLEQDIALTNTALDLIGQARLLYQLIAGYDEVNADEDKLSMLRYEHEYYNLLLVEQPNKDFGYTMARQFFYDAFNLLQYEELLQHADAAVKSIAVKTLKEIKYHYRYSSEWMVRLGDGTEKSHQMINAAVNDLWRYTGEMFTPAGYEVELIARGYVPDIQLLHAPWLDRIQNVFNEAGLQVPDSGNMLTGGKQGRHTEHMGYILTELQYMQRTYPDMQW